MAGSGRKSGDQVLALGLATGMTVEAAARQANLAPRTAHRRLGEASFQRKVDELRGELVRQALGRLTEGMTAAADTMRALLSAESESVRLAAARAILDSSCRLREAAEFDQRLREVEDQLLHPGGQHP
jgi:hypothetical protein